MERQAASPTVVPNQITRAPALRFQHARHPTRNNHHPRNVHRSNLKPPCCCCCRAGIEMPVDKLRRVALGHVKATLVRTSMHRGDMQIGAESNRKSLTPRVRAISQLPFRASALSAVVRRRVSTSMRASFALSTVRYEVYRRCWWTRYYVGAVCVLC